LVGLGVDAPDEKESGDGGGEEDEDDPQGAHLFLCCLAAWWGWVGKQSLNQQCLNQRDFFFAGCDGVGASESLPPSSPFRVGDFF
jgi:hypothetical protein